jgi:hypothetical protein
MESESKRAGGPAATPTAGAVPTRDERVIEDRAMWHASRSHSPGYGRRVKNQVLGMGAMIGIGAAIGVLFMPMFGPLALAAGAAIGVVFGAALESRHTTR